MPHGTGIASYGTMLAKTLTTMGHEVDGLFGIDPGQDPSLREVLFYERLAHAPKPRRRPLHHRLMERWTAGQAPIVEVPRTGRVETRVFADRIPDFRAVWTRGGLFELASRRFRATGKITEIDLPEAPDVMHWTYPLPLRVRNVPNIYTIHDLVPLRLPYTTLDRKTEFKALLDACVASAAQICTVSDASARDIEDMFGDAVGKVTNTHQISSLWDGSARAEAGDPAALRAFGLEARGYFLFFGAVEPKKNIGRLLEAYLGLDTDTPLVLVSSRSWQSEQELVLLSRLEAQGAGASVPPGLDRIVRLDHMPRSILKGLIAQARAVVFPSLYEGFGLPVHEAMLMGTPVLTSDRGGLREVAGDAAVVVDPYDPLSIRGGLARIDTDAELRERLSREGKAHAAQFSIDRYSAALASLYQRTIAHHEMMHG
jgi:glycosyltransferase involved in cell wall biosynthesis